MRRRFEWQPDGWRATCVGFLLLASAGLGCRSHQYARVVKPGERDMVGSHQAGGETFKPLVEESVGKLLARHSEPAFQPASFEGAEVVPPGQKRICFVGVENCSAEEIGDFKEQLFESIDGKILESRVFQPISRRYVEAGLRETRIRPDQLFVPENMMTFVAHMEQQGQPFDYLLFAKITSGTTRENANYQRDYLLTLELVDIRTGVADKQSAEISKGYHKTPVGRWTAMHFLRWD